MAVFPVKYAFAIALLTLMGLNCQISGSKAIDQGQMLQAIDRGLQFLQQIQRADGAVCDTLNPLFDVWETALAAGTWLEVRQDSTAPFFVQALDFLKTNENAAGLICHNRKCREAYCLETTAVYYQLLWSIGRKNQVLQGIDTLLQMQFPDGHWDVGNPDVREAKSFPSVTAFMINLLTLTQQSNPLAVQWLAKQQLSDGHWGMHWEYYGTPAYAIWQIVPGLEKQIPLSSTLDWILDQQQADGSWIIEAREPHKIGAALNTALYLSALLHVPSADHELALKRGIRFLLDQQRADGSWDGGHFPIPSESYTKEEYVFATTRALAVIHQYLNLQFPAQ